jgi:TolB-like protein
MKRIIFAVLFVAVAAVAALSQPKIAVLDAIIPQNMDPSVIIPITEKIAERLVVSGRFTVLDRANIDSVLKEREFEVSGMVSDQDVVTAGKYLGADFVVVAKVQKVSDTYFISAKMINIKTGVIANQTSAEGEGKLSTLIGLGAQVGEVLSGGAVTAVSSTGNGQTDISKSDTTVAPPPVADTIVTPPVAPPPVTPPPKKVSEKFKSRLLFSGGTTDGTISNSLPAANGNGSGLGFDVFVLLPSAKGISLVTNVDSVAFDLGTYTESFVDVMAGLGLAFKLGPFVPFADVKGGLSFGDDSSSVYSYTWNGMGTCLGVDVGANLDLGRWFVLGLRYQYVGVSIAWDDKSGSAVDLSSIFLSAGIRF